MKFLCMCYYDAAAFANFTEEDFKKMGEICAPRDEEFKASGKVKAYRLARAAGSVPHAARGRKRCHA